MVVRVWSPGMVSPPCCCCRERVLKHMTHTDIASLTRFLYLYSTIQRAPILIVYDAACKAAAQIARRRADMLENGGKLPRLGGDGGTVTVVEGPEGTGEPHAKGDDGASSLPRVYLPQLAHLGSHGGFNSLEVKPCSFPVEPVRESTADVYALKEASLPQPGVQSRVDVRELLRQSSNKSVPAGRSSFLATTRSLAFLLREGIRTLSLFEVIVLRITGSGRHRNAD